jgi:hypothetical protein
VEEGGQLIARVGVDERRRVERMEVRARWLIMMADGECSPIFW